MEKLHHNCMKCEVRACSILKKCQRELLEEINEKKNCLAFREGQPIIHTWLNYTGIYVIASGVAKLYRLGHKGRPFIFRLLKEGDIFGYRFDGEDASEPLMVDAVEDCEVCFIPKEDFENVIELSHDVREELYRFFQHELNYLLSHTCNLMQMNVQEKIAFTLLHIAEVYEVLNGEHKKTHVNLSRQDIADLAGTTKEQVSRALTEFKEDNIISVSGKYFELLDTPRLKAIAGLGA